MLHLIAQCAFMYEQKTNQSNLLTVRLMVRKIRYLA